MRAMARWQPDARGRLEAAAMALYLERGFDDTTVADIAARAGLTERTFFRHFADKREVLFSGAGSLQELLVSTLASTPDSVAPIDAVAVALEAAEPDDLARAHLGVEGFRAFAKHDAVGPDGERGVGVMRPAICPFDG